MPNHAHFVLWLMVDPEIDEAILTLDDHKGTFVPNDTRRGEALRPPSKGGHNVVSEDEHLPYPKPAERVQIYGQEGGRESTPLQRGWAVPAAQATNEQPYLGEVVGAWKSLIMKVYLQWITAHDPSRRAKFWQRNYYDRIIRNDRALSAIRQYIHDNPGNWSLDPDNPANDLQLPLPETIDDYLDDIRRHDKRNA